MVGHAAGGNWRCVVFGHRADDLAAYYGDWTCVACGRPDTEPVLVLRAGVLERLRWRWWRVRLIIRDVWGDTAFCRGCNQRVKFGPDECTCIPF